MSSAPSPPSPSKSKLMSITAAKDKSLVSSLEMTAAVLSPFHLHSADQAVNEFCESFYNIQRWPGILLVERKALIIHGRLCLKDLCKILLTVLLAECYTHLYWETRLYCGSVRASLCGNSQVVVGGDQTRCRFGSMAGHNEKSAGWLPGDYE